jgi:hypothetical protein
VQHGCAGKLTQPGPERQSCAGLWQALWGKSVLNFRLSWARWHGASLHFVSHRRYGLEGFAPIW